MRSNSIVLSDEEHLDLTSYSAEMMLVCFKRMKDLAELCDLEAVPFPNSCKMNFRDTWFHYKKIFERYDSIKVHQEQYAMEEHMIRILKDAYIVLFNEYARRIENAYALLGKSQKVLENLKNSRGDDYFRPYEDIKISADHWYYYVDQRYSEENKSCLDPEQFSNEDNDKTIEIDLFLFLTQADIRKYRVTLQECMHKIKNLSLKLRLQGVEIFRPDNFDKYLDGYLEGFGKVKTTLDDCKIRAVLRRFSYYYDKFYSQDDSSYVSSEPSKKRK